MLDSPTWSTFAGETGPSNRWRVAPCSRRHTGNTAPTIEKIMTENEPPAASGGTSAEERALPSQERSSDGPDPTVGTGTIMAVGCLVLLLVAVLVLAATRYLPHLIG